MSDPHPFAPTDNRDEQHICVDGWQDGSACGEPPDHPSHLDDALFDPPRDPRCFTPVPF